MTSALRNKLLVGVLGHAPLVLFAAVFLAFGCLSDRFLEYRNLAGIVTQASYIGIAAIGMTVVLLTGGIDLSIGANMYVSAIIAGLLMRDFGAPAWLALAACLAAGGLFGAVNALLVTRLGLIPFVATFGMLVAGRGVGRLITQSETILFSDSVLEIGSSSVANLVPLPIAIFALVACTVHAFLTCTPAGRQTYAVGNGLDAARNAGIPTRRILGAAYVVCGVTAALAGFVSVAQQGSLDAGFGQGDEFDAIAAAVLGGASLFGGVGSVLPGTVLGAILFRTVSAGLVSTQTDLYLQPLVTAAIIFAAVLLDSVRMRVLAALSRRPIRTET